MKSNTTAVLALLLSGLLALCITALALAHQQSPEILSTIALVALGIGGGIANPRSTSEAATAAVAAEAAAVVIPEQRAAADQPVATHAP